MPAEPKKSAKKTLASVAKPVAEEPMTRAKKDFTSPLHHVFSKNLRELLSHRSWSNRKLYLRSDVSDRYIAHLVEREHTPTLEVVEKLADAFNIEPWQFLMKDMNIQSVESGTLSRLLSLFLKLDLATQGYIVKRLEKEFSDDIAG